MKKTRLFMLFMITLALTNCQKNKELDAKDPVVSNEEMTVSGTQARFEWCVDFSGQFQTGVELSQNENMTDVRRVEATKEEDKYVAIVSDLSMGTKYYYRIVVWNKFNNYEEETKSFTTSQTFKVTLACLPEEGGSAMGDGTYTSGDTCMVKATAKEGYVFVKWTEDGNQVSIDAEYSFKVTGDRTLVANFSSQEQDYTIKATADPTEGGTVSGDGDFHYGETCTLTANPATGYRFVNWTKGDDVVHGEATYIFPVTESAEYVAHFQLAAFDLGVTANPTVIAQGGSSQLNAIASGGSGSFTYSWDNSSSLNDATIHNPTASPTVTTIYKCTVTSGEHTQDGSCTVTVVCPPSNLNAEVQNTNNVYLSWTESNPAESYKVYRNSEYITSVTATTYYDSDLIAGIYNYQVSVVYQGVESPKSNMVSADIYNSLSVTATATPSTIPEGGSSILTANASGGNGNYTYSWTPTEGLDNANIQSPTASPNSTTEYTVIVSSNGQSAEKHVTVNVVKAPTGLTATVQNDNVHLTWITASPADGYKVYRNNTLIAQIGATSSYDDSSLNEGTYNYQVSTVYQGVESPKSDPAQATIALQAPIGSINGLFTINSNGDQVYFSQGNLQYQASSNTWRFSENQWDYVGNESNGTVYENGIKCDNTQISSTYDGWIDLFGFGTSGYDHGANCYLPWSTSQNYWDYYAYGNGQTNLYDQSGKADWGYNAIYNGGNIENSGWRTLTNEEWIYVFRDRDSDIRYARAKVNGVNGMILLPDNWKSSYYPLENINPPLEVIRGCNYENNIISFEDNIISSVDWFNSFEANGAVFLPAAGGRGGTSVYSAGGQGYYRTSSCSSDVIKVRVVFFNSSAFDIGFNDRWRGFSVRLVRNAQ